MVWRIKKVRTLYVHASSLGSIEQPNVIARRYDSPAAPFFKGVTRRAYILVQRVHDLPEITAGLHQLTSTFLVEGSTNVQASRAQNISL